MGLPYMGLPNMGLPNLGTARASTTTCFVTTWVVLERLARSGQIKPVSWPDQARSRSARWLRAGHGCSPTRRFRARLQRTHDVERDTSLKTALWRHSPTRRFEGVRCAWRLRQRQYRQACGPVAEALPKGHRSGGGVMGRMYNHVRIVYMRRIVLDGAQAVRRGVGQVTGIPGMMVR
jgi:hypothetical protein